MFGFKKKKQGDRVIKEGAIRPTGHPKSPPPSSLTIGKFEDK